MREAIKERKTKETEVKVKINLDGEGKSNIDTQVPFLDHMIELFSYHAQYDLNISAKGDIHIDAHHTTEDVALTLALAFNEALGEKRGIERYGFFRLCMDEALTEISLDLSGRSFISYNVEFPSEKIGSFDTELVEEFFTSFSRSANITLHLDLIRGKNSHHIAEALFKCFGRALKEATRINPKRGCEIPSSKGIL